MLKNRVQWTRSWIDEIFSAAAWLQVAMLCGYKRELAMRTMHKGLHRALVTSEHNTRATVKAVYSQSYHMPTPGAKAVFRRMASETCLLGGREIRVIAVA